MLTLIGKGLIMDVKIIKVKEMINNQIKNKSVFIKSLKDEDWKTELTTEIKGLKESLDIIEKVFI